MMFNQYKQQIKAILFCHKEPNNPLSPYVLVEQPALDMSQDGYSSSNFMQQ
jgi:hypothetical protein